MTNFYFLWNIRQKVESAYLEAFSARRLYSVLPYPELLFDLLPLEEVEITC